MPPNTGKIQHSGPRVVGLEFISKEGAVKASPTVEVADTPESRRIGLSKRAELHANCGMFFDKAGSFWMRDVNFPLDLLFTDTNGTVLQKHTMVVDKKGSTLYHPDNAYAAHAIELPLGYADKHGIVVGDTVRAKEAK